jgi:hypothetical protein
MADLGSFGAALKALDPAAEKDTFTYFGEKFEIVSALPPMLMFQLAAAMTGKVDETEGMAALWEAFRISLDEPDLEPWDGPGEDQRPAPKQQFNRLYRIAVDKRDSTEGLMTVVMAIYQNDAGRPTVQPSDSSGGLSSISPSSSPSSTATDSAPALGLVDRSQSDDFIPVSRILAG